MSVLTAKDAKPACATDYAKTSSFRESSGG
jgi:hypothetical protein